MSFWSQNILKNVFDIIKYLKKIEIAAEADGGGGARGQLPYSS